MRGWNCRLVERNDEPVKLGWTTVRADNPQRAAAAYCHTADVWDRVSWGDGDSGLVEVEEHGGEDGTHRIVMSAYTSLEFSATPEGEA